MADTLWKAALDYHKTASENFYLEDRFNPEDYEGTGAWYEGKAKEYSREQFPPGYGKERETVVHYLFPNLNDVQRDALASFLHVRETIQVFAMRFPEERARFVGEFDNVRRDCEAVTQEQIGNLTVAQMAILEKYFFSVLTTGAAGGDERKHDE